MYKKLSVEELRKKYGDLLESDELSAISHQKLPNRAGPTDNNKVFAIAHSNKDTLVEAVVSAFEKYPFLREQ